MRSIQTAGHIGEKGINAHAYPCVQFTIKARSYKHNKITLSKVTDAVIVFWSCVLIVMLYFCSPTTVSAIKNRALSTGSNNNNYDSQFNKVVSQFCSLYSLLGKCCQYSIADLLLFICCYRDRFWIHSCLLSATLTWAWIWKMTKLRT